jgi:hypothetical protein
MTDRPQDPRGVLILGALTTSRRVRLFLAAALFLGWLGWLGYAAAVKSRAPVVSRAQAAVTTYAVVADLRAGAGGVPTAKAVVTEVLAGSGPPAGTTIDVENLSEAHGFDGDGDYLLLLRQDPAAGGYAVVGQQRSPGYDPTFISSKPLIYRWSDDVRAQGKRLFP